MRMYKTHATEIIKWSITTWRKTLLANSRLASEEREELENYIVGTFDIRAIRDHSLRTKSPCQYIFLLLVAS